jgi:hypothetical protein
VNDPLFRGVHVLLFVIRSLVSRPKWRPRRGRDGLRGDRPLPLLCLIRDSGRNDVLDALSDHLGRAGTPRKRKVPSVLVRTDHAKEDSEDHWSPLGREVPLLPLLDVLHRRLLSDRFGPDGLRSFRHYRLVDWLTGQCPLPGSRRDDRTITDVLRDWYAVADSPADADQRTAVEQAAQSLWARLFVLALTIWNRPLRFWLWVHGVPPIGREPRWLMRQPFMVPGHSTAFTGFAERLTVIRRGEESLEHLKKLLVHAFLQDLRLAYRPRRLSLRRWQRTAYTVVLLDGVTEENGGWELLRLINDVRNESTEHDPLLVIATAAAKPDDLQTDRPLAPVSRIKGELDAWRAGLPGHRQSLRPDARFVFARLPAQVGADATLSQEDDSAWSDLGDIQPRKPPLPARKPVVAAILGAVLVAGLLTGGRWGYVRLEQRCLPDPRSGVAVRWVDDIKTCIGYSDDAAHVFGDDRRLEAVQLAIFELNREAERLHKDNSDRVVVSLVYFADVTRRKSGPNTYDSVSEELEGLLIQQKAQNRPSPDEPLLRVIVANGGDEMKAARTVVDEFLDPLLARDSSVLGVVGMGLTRPATESAIGALGDLGTPVLATSLTGEGLGGLSPLYFQLVPGNRVQAELIADYARVQGKPVTVYHPVPDDNYLRSLVDELDRALGGPPARSWTGRVGEVSVDCGREEIAFFAGREVEFTAFLSEMIRKCDDDRPMIIGDDSVSRFVAQGEERRRNEFKGVAVSFVSMGSRVVLAGPDCLESGLPAAGRAAHGSTQALTEFCAGHHLLRDSTGPDRVAEHAGSNGKHEGRMRWPGERVGLAFDAAGVFVDAVRNNLDRNRVANPDKSASSVERGRRVHRAAVAQELREPNKFRGATGPIDFAESRTGWTRPVAILTIADIYDLDQAPKCAYEITMPAGTSTKPRGSSDC